MCRGCDRLPLGRLSRNSNESDGGKAKVIIEVVGSNLVPWQIELVFRKRQALRDGTHFLWDFVERRLE
jgi:hypothetical protein